jgi:hypothetical protein
MSTPREPQPGKLCSRTGWADWWDMQAGFPRWAGGARLWGLQVRLAFDHTDYDEELGRPFSGACSSGCAPDGLVAVKLATNERAQHPGPTARRVNLDPGLITLERLVLASGKNFTHRIYLGQGIWADLTLIYNKKTGWVVLPWTFPDYATEDMKRRLTELRALYKTTVETAALAAPQGVPQCP